MDIRIGNDIRIDVTLQNLGISSVADIDSVKCVLLKECTHKDARSNKPFCYPSKYTIGCCGAPVYNVYPYNITAQYFHTAPNCFMASCLHCNSGCKEVEIEAYVSEQDSKVHMCYHAEDQECGEYALILSVTIREDDWKSDGKHTCSFGYGKLFRVVKEVFGKCGTILINLPKCNNYDIDGVALGKFESDKCTITAVPDYEERGYTTGSGEYRYGQAVKLTAVNYELYTFACWDDGERSAARIVTANGDATYTALFSDGTIYTAYFYDEDKSTELAHYDLTYGSIIPSPRVQDKEQKKFVGWNEPIAKYMPEHDVIYYAVYHSQDLKVITVRANNDDYGTVTGSTSANVGASVTMTAAAKDHYYFDRWEKDGEVVSRNSIHTIVVTGSETYTAVFSPRQYVIKVMTSGDGHVEVNGQRYSGGTYTYSPTLKVTMTAIGENNYTFNKWSDGNTSNPRMISVDSDATYTAEFTTPSYLVFTITASSNPPSVCNISVQPNVVQPGGSSTLAVSNILTGYTFTGWYRGGVLESADTTYTINNINEIRHYVAQFAVDQANTVRMAVRAEDTGHSVISTSTPTSLAWLLYNDNKSAQEDVIVGSSVKMQAKMNDNTWKFERWLFTNTQTQYQTIESGSDGEVEISSVSASDEGGYSAIFSKRPYYIDCNHASKTSGQNSEYYTYGETVLVTPILPEGYTFAYWKKNGATIQIGLNGYSLGENNELQFTVNTYTASTDSNNPTMYTPAYTQASPTPEVYTGMVNLNVWPNNAGSVSGDGQYTEGDQVTLIVTYARTGEYRFKQWNKGDKNGTKVSNDAEYTFTFSLATSGTYTAVFEPIPYTISTSVSPSGAGQITRSPNRDYYTYGESVQLTATNNSGYTFLRWENNSTSRNRTVTVSGNLSVTAIFQPIIPTPVEQAPTYYYGMMDDTQIASSTAAQIIESNETLSANTSISTSYPISTQSIRIFFMMYEENTECNATIQLNNMTLEIPRWYTTSKTNGSTTYTFKFIPVNGTYNVTNITYTH